MKKEIQLIPIDNASHLIDELSERLKLDVDFDVLPDAVHLFFKGGEYLRNLICFDSRPAEWAVEILFQPTDLLLDLLSAFRTGDWNDFAVKYTHDVAS